MAFTSGKRIVPIFFIGLLGHLADTFPDNGVANTGPTNLAESVRWVDRDLVNILSVEPAGREIYVLPDGRSVNTTILVSRVSASVMHGNQSVTGEIPGKFSVQFNDTYYSLGGEELSSKKSEILIASNGAVSWIPGKIHDLPENMVVGGFDPESMETVYICRFVHRPEKLLMTGKLSQSGVCRAPFVGLEVTVDDNYEVLVENYLGSINNVLGVPIDIKTDNKLHINQLIYESKKVEWLNASLVAIDVGRSPHQITEDGVTMSGLIPGKVYEVLTGRYSYQGVELFSEKNVTEVLAYPRGSVSWVKIEYIRSNSKKLIGGVDPKTRETLYICRLLHTHQNIPLLITGKLTDSRLCRIPLLGGEVTHETEFEVLTLNLLGEVLDAGGY